MPTQAELDAFLAKGGTIKKIAEGDNVGITRKEWYLATRSITPPRVVTDYDNEQQSEIEMETVREAALIGGRTGAIQALNDVRGSARRKPTRKHDRAVRNYEAQARYNEQWGVDY